MATTDGFQALRCADCARSDSAVTDLRPAQRIEIPADALGGFPEGGAEGGRAYTRRQALRNGVVGVASIYGATKMPWEAIWESARADAAGGMQKSVVVVYLQGGCDSLNMFVPSEATQFAQYTTLRSPGGGSIARVAGPSANGRVGMFPMPGTVGQELSFANPLVSAGNAGDNGDTKGFDTLYGAGDGAAGSDLAIFPAADYSPPNLSHFDSRDFWFAGALQKLPTGWIGRWLDLYGSLSNPLQAISLDSSLSKQIRSARAPSAAIDGLNSIGFDVRYVDARSGAGDPTTEIGRLAAVPSNGGGLGRARDVYGLTTEMSNRLSTLSSPLAAAGYPQSQLSSRLQTAAVLLGAGLGTRVVTIDWGSFDTHGSQVQGQDPQLKVLSSALAAFQADLRVRGIEQDVITLVFSEFGRRAASNDSLGTDHGAGGPMLVIGSAVRGGLAGEHPGVTSLDQDGDLKVQTDFRSVYGSIIGEWLGGDAAAVLPGGPFPGIARHDGGTTLLK